MEYLPIFTKRCISIKITLPCVLTRIASCHMEMNHYKIWGKVLQFSNIMEYLPFFTNSCIWIKITTLSFDNDGISHGNEPLFINKVFWKSKFIEKNNILKWYLKIRGKLCPQKNEIHKMSDQNIIDFSQCSTALPIGIENHESF